MSDNEDIATIVVGEERSAPVMPEQDWPLDEVCAAAVEMARTALLEEVDVAQVGDPLGLIAEGPQVVTHYFGAHVPGYRGWRWAVTVTRTPDTDHVTVDETALIPDVDALLAPAWVPWRNRVQSGDIGAGDVLVTAADDPRLIPGMVDNDTVDAEDELEPQEWELGLGRLRILSPEGRREAAHRWYREAGPRSPIARAAEMPCATCGFLLLIGGPLGQAFGVCANGFSPVDGRIVAMDFGCGAHSETVQAPTVPVADIVVDEVGYDEVPAEAEPEPEAEPEVDAEPEAAAEADPEPKPESEADAPQGAAQGDVATEPQPDAPPDSGEPAPHETMVESDTAEEGS